MAVDVSPVWAWEPEVKLAALNSPAARYRGQDLNDSGERSNILSLPTYVCG